MVCVDVRVEESNFCVVKYLSLEFGIYMDYFGTDVWKLEMKYEWWSDFRAWLLGLTIKGTIRCFVVKWLDFWLDYWAKWGLFFDGRNGRVVMMDSGVSMWMNQLCEISKYSDNLLVLTTPCLNIQTINRSHHYFTPKNRYFTWHNTISVQFKIF